MTVIAETTKRLTTDARGAAGMFGKSRSAWLAGCARGDFPPGYRLGGSRRWSIADLENWLGHGCPPAVRWDRLRAAR